METGIGIVVLGQTARDQQKTGYRELVNHSCVLVSDNRVHQGKEDYILPVEVASNNKREEKADFLL